MSDPGDEQVITLTFNELHDLLRQTTEAARRTGEGVTPDIVANALMVGYLDRFQPKQN